MNFFYQIKQEKSSFVIRFFLKEEVGVVVFTKGEKSFSIQYQLEAKFRGKGLGKEIVKQAISLLSRKIDGEILIEATVIPSNDSSISVLKSNGFSLVEETEHYLFFVKKTK